MGYLSVHSTPYLAASPDAIITCDCCGDRPLEVKNPFKYRHMSIQNFAQQKDSCLEVKSDGTISLKYRHQYYGQSQLQMLSVASKQLALDPPSFSSKRGHVTEKHVQIVCKHGMFGSQTFEV